MRYPEGSPQASLRSTADKYGAVMLFNIFNYIFLAFLLHFAFVALLALFTGSGTIDTSTDIGYAESMFLNSLVSYLPLFIVFGLLFKRDLSETNSMYPYPKETGELVILFFAGGCLGRIGALFTAYVSDFMNDLFNVPVPEAAFSDSISQDTVQFITFEIFSVVVAPICEELIYRHLLLRPLRRYGDMQAAVISSLIFGLGHFNFDQFLYTFLFGFSLAVAAIRRDSIIPSVIIHMVNNALAGFSSYLPETFGNAVVDSIFDSLAMLSNLSGLVILYGGAIAVILALKKHLFVFREPWFMTDKEQFGVIFTSPLVIAGIACSLILTFFLLYI